MSGQLPTLDSIPLPTTDTIPLPQEPCTVPSGKTSKRGIKLVRYDVSKPSNVPLPPTPPPPLPSEFPTPLPVKANKSENKHQGKLKPSEHKFVSASNGNADVETKSDVELADLKRTLMQKERNVEGPMEQSIVDEMFKDFLASKMQQIETEYKNKKLLSDNTDIVDGQANSVEEMNKLLDDELNMISQNTPIKKMNSGATVVASKVVKESSTGKLSGKSGHTSSVNKKSSKWDVKVKTEKRDVKDKAETTHKHSKSKTKDENKKTEFTNKVVDLMGSKLPSFQVKITVNDNNNIDSSSKVTSNTETSEASVSVDSTESKPGLNKLTQGKKSVGKMNMFKINVTKTSAELISSGVPEKDLARLKAMEEGEVLSSNGDEVSDSNEEESEDDGEKDNEISETGSISDSDKESKVSKSKKKKKKKKSKHKKKKKHKSSKEKENSDKKGSTKRKHRSTSRSKSPKKHKRSRSRSPSSRHSRRSSSPSHDKYGGKWVDRGFDAYAYRDRDTDRWRDKDRNWRNRDRERDQDRHRSRSRSRSHDREKEKVVKDLRVKIDKAKLREIAIKNALAMAKSGQGPSVDITSIKAGGKSVDELTDFCKRISSKEKKRDDYLSSSSSESEGEKSDEKEDTFIHHPFKVRDAGSAIVMNIRNAKALPVMTPQEKVVENSKLRLQFPVSSGSTHRLKESEWVPVEKTTATTTTVTKATPVTAVASTTEATVTSLATTATVSTVTAVDVAKEIGQAAKAPVQNPPLNALPPPPPPEDRVFPDPPAVPIDIGSIISERLNAVRKLQENPRDLEAMSSIAKAQKKASLWAQSKQLPGQFTGSTGAQILSQDELIGPNKKRQAWAKKDQFINATPLSGGIGMALLQKMGWKQGTGLGKNNEGSLEPLALDFKTDRKGLTSQEENPRSKASYTAAPVTKDLSGKHPVSALVELCNKRKWGAPDFQLVHESGPDHKKNFLFKVIVNRTEYQPSVASNNKKLAKASAAAACLQELGLIPRT